MKSYQHAAKSFWNRVPFEKSGVSIWVNDTDTLLYAFDALIAKYQLPQNRLSINSSHHNHPLIEHCLSELLFPLNIDLKLASNQWYLNDTPWNGHWVEPLSFVQDSLSHLLEEIEDGKIVQLKYLSYRNTIKEEFSDVEILHVGKKWYAAKLEQFKSLLNINPTIFQALLRQLTKTHRLTEISDLFNFDGLPISSSNNSRYLPDKKSIQLFKDHSLVGTGYLRKI